MDSDVTLKEFDYINDGIISDENGNTNKKCPRCGNDIIVIERGSAYTIKCKTPGCISLDFRGI